jgi:hypothetical protein
MHKSNLKIVNKMATGVDDTRSSAKPQTGISENVEDRP